MIRVILEGGATEGRWNYRIATQGTRLAVPIHGLSATPLFDACRKLKELGAAQDQDLIGLYRETGMPESQYQMRTSVGYGAKTTVAETGAAPRFTPHVPMPPDAVARVTAPSQEPLKTPEGTDVTPQAEKPAVGGRQTQETAIPDKWENEGGAVEATGAKSAKSAAAPPPRHRPPEPPDDRGPARSGPAKPGSSHHKRKPKASGARRGQR